MKKYSVIVFLGLFLLLCVFNIQAQQTEQRQFLDVHHSVGPNTNYKLYPTFNMYTFLKLDTRYGIVTQVQYTTDNDSKEFETYLDSPYPLVPDSEAVVGRYELYPTSNYWTFMLLDQITGKIYHVQWSQKGNEGIWHIPLCTMEEWKDDMKFKFDSEHLTANISDVLWNMSGNYVIPSEINYACNHYDIVGIESGSFTDPYMTSIVISKTIRKIDKGAFYRCNRLDSIVVVEDNTVYDSREGCNAIIETSTNKLICGCNTTVIPQDVTIIGSNAFSGSGIKSIVIPIGVQSIGDYAFFDCNNLVSVVLPDSLRSINENAFQWCRRLSEIVIPSKVDYIGKGAFANCDNLTSITLSDSLRMIGEDAFRGCNSLSELVIPSGVKYIGAGAFRGCSNLTSITLSDSLRIIGEDAFKGCNSLSELVIPANVKRIETGAFANCKNLKKIEIQATVPPIIEETTFEGLDKKILITVPAGTAKHYKRANGWYLLIN